MHIGKTNYSEVVFIGMLSLYLQYQSDARLPSIVDQPPGAGGIHSQLQESLQHSQAHPCRDEVG